MIQMLLKEMGAFLAVLSRDMSVLESLLFAFKHVEMVLLTQERVVMI